MFAYMIWFWTLWKSFISSHILSYSDTYAFHFFAAQSVPILLTTFFYNDVLSRSCDTRKRSAWTVRCWALPTLPASQRINMHHVSSLAKEVPASASKFMYIVYRLYLPGLDSFCFASPVQHCQECQRMGRSPGLRAPDIKFANATQSGSVDSCWLLDHWSFGLLWGGLPQTRTLVHCLVAKGTRSSNTPQSFGEAGCQGWGATSLLWICPRNAKQLRQCHHKMLCISVCCELYEL